MQNRWTWLAVGLLLFSCQQTRWWGPTSSQDTRCDPASHPALRGAWKSLLESRQRVRACLQISWRRSLGDGRSALVELTPQGKLWGRNPTSGAFDSSVQLQLPSELQSRERRFLLFVFGPQSQGDEDKQLSVCQKMALSDYDCHAASPGDCWFYMAFQPDSPAATAIPASDEGRRCVLHARRGAASEQAEKDGGPPQPNEPQVITLAGPPSGVDGRAQDARMEGPTALLTGPQGKYIYFSERRGHRIRRFEVQSGGFETVAGTGWCMSDHICHADGPALKARFKQPEGLAFDAKGALYIADSQNNVIRRLHDGAVSTYAGTPPVKLGEGGRKDGVRSQASFRGPQGLAFGPRGALYVADTQNHCIRKIDGQGNVSTYAGACAIPGEACKPGAADGARLQASFHQPSGLAFDDAGALYVADTGNHKIRKIAPDGTVSTFAGSTAGHKDGAGSQAQLAMPQALTWGPDGFLYVADSFNRVLRKIDGQGQVSTYAGTPGTSGSVDGALRQATFVDPSSLAFAAGSLYVSEDQGDSLRKIDGSQVRHFAGGFIGKVVDGKGHDARFDGPKALAVAPNGTLYLTEARVHMIRKIDLKGVVSTLAGTGQKGHRDGKGSQALFDTPSGIAVSSKGDIFIADTGNHRIRKLTAQGEVSTFAGEGLFGLPTEPRYDGIGTSARFSSPTGLWIDRKDDALYVVDAGSTCVRKVTASAVVSTLLCENDTKSLFSDILLGLDGMLYITDKGKHGVTQITQAGALVRWAGHPDFKPGLQNGPRDAARFNDPRSFVQAKDGSVYISDTVHHLIRKIDPRGVVSTLAGPCQATPCYGGSRDGPARTAEFRFPDGLALDLQGDLLVADSGNYRIRKILLSPR